MTPSESLVELIRELVREELQKKDATEYCTILSTQPWAGTMTVSLLSDPDTTLPNIINASKYTFESGDVGVLYKIGNELNNCFVIAKVTPDTTLT